MYDEKLDTLIYKTKSTIVIRGIKEYTFKSVENKLIAQKVISKIESPKSKEAKTIRSLFVHTLTNKLHMEIDVVNSLQIEELYKNDNHDLIILFKNPSNVSYIYSLTNNLNKDDLVSITDYVPGEFYKSHRDLNAISQILRKQYGLATHIRLGFNDYNLYAKEKSDKTKWMEIQPYRLNEDIAKFEIGKVPVNTENKRLKRDIQNVIENEQVYPCDQCEYNALTQEIMNDHIINKHEHVYIDESNESNKNVVNEKNKKNDNVIIQTSDTHKIVSDLVVECVSGSIDTSLVNMEEDEK